MISLSFYSWSNHRKLAKCFPKIVVRMKDGNVTSKRRTSTTTRTTTTMTTPKKKDEYKFIAICVRCCRKTIIIETASLFTCRFSNAVHNENYHFSLVDAFFSSSWTPQWFMIFDGIVCSNMIYIKRKTICEDNKTGKKQSKANQTNEIEEGKKKLRHSQWMQCNEKERRP